MNNILQNMTNKKYLEIFSTFLTAQSQSNSLGHLVRLIIDILTLAVRLPGAPGSPKRTRRRLPGVKFCIFSPQNVKCLMCNLMLGK